MGVSSEQGCTNMNRFVVACAFVACAYGAPMPDADYAHGVVGAVGYAGAGLVGAPVASAPAVVGQTHHSYAAGAPVVENRVEYGIVGQRTVQTGVQQVVAGHAYAVAGQETIPQPAHSYVAGAPKNLVETVALPPPAIPAPPAPYAAIPLHLSQLAQLPPTPLSSKGSLLPSGPTPESPLRSPTLCQKSTSRTTMSMSLLLSHVPFPVRSSRSPTLPSLTRFPSHVPSMSQLLTRFTPSRKSLRLPTSTTPPSRLTPARLS